jgi:hypothetical protein
MFFERFFMMVIITITVILMTVRFPLADFKIPLDD